MKAAHPSAWFQRGIKKSQTQERDPTSRLLSPEPSSSRPTSTPTSFNLFNLTIRNKDLPRPSSAASTRSVYSATPTTPRPTIYIQDLHTHPFATMVHAPLPVVSSHDSSEEEEECPVCLEPLSFSFRLPGEKPHIVPECGHALHEVSRFHISRILPRYGRLYLGMYAPSPLVSEAGGQLLYKFSCLYPLSSETPPPLRRGCSDSRPCSPSATLVTPSGACRM